MKKRYTWRHDFYIQMEYDVFADSRQEAYEVAYQKYLSDEDADNELVKKDSWHLVEVAED